MNPSTIISVKIIVAHKIIKVTNVLEEFSSELKGGEIIKTEAVIEINSVSEVPAINRVTSTKIGSRYKNVTLFKTIALNKMMAKPIPSAAYVASRSEYPFNT